MKDIMKEDYRSRRSVDEKREAIVAQYLDKYFYPNWTTSTERNYDRATQIAGLDLTVVDFRGDKITIDEKAATRWVGRNLPTFAHEISSININGCEYDGWLLDFNSSSDYLVEVWIDDAKDTSINDYTDITDATIALIPKKNIWSYLEKKHIDYDKLKSIAKELRCMCCPYSYYNGLKVSCQIKQHEHAANLLIPRDSIVNFICTYAVRIKGGKIMTLRNAL